VRGTTYESFDQLVLYCRRVAGTIGRVCLAIFSNGSRVDTQASELADDLGVAFQLTNILRDVREDAGSGRVYLPAEDLRRFEVIAGANAAAAARTLASITSADAPADGERDARRRLVALVGFEAERAQQWFRRGAGLVPLLDRRSAACVVAMAGIYRRLLDRIAEDPERALLERVSLPAREQVWVAARALAGRGR
jgi:phytoene synthase